MFNNNRTIYEIIGGVLAVVLVVVFFLVGRGGANQVIDDAQATAQALQNTVSELQDAPPPWPDLSDDLEAAEAEIDLLGTQVAEFLAIPTQHPVTATPEPTATAIPPTATPEFCYPSDLDEVVVIRDPRVSLSYSMFDNKAGKMVLNIYVDENGNKVQYLVGDTFFIFEDPIVVDGGGTVYEVFGPRGEGLFVKSGHIKLFDATPNLYLCGV